MPPAKTSFKTEWLEKKDSNGHFLKNWCEPRSKNEAYCLFCKKLIKFDNRGLGQLVNHSESKLHIALIKDVASGKQPTFVIRPDPCSSKTKGLSSGPSTSTRDEQITCWTTKNQTVKAEITWALKVINDNIPFNSAQDLNMIFRTMFPDSNIAMQFSMGPSKLSYITTEAIGPHFHNALVIDVKNSNSCYSLSFDELTNKQIKKQLDINIRYWSTQYDKVVVHHLATYLLNQAKGQDIADKLIKSINDSGLPLKDFLTLGSDGPNVNKTVFSKVSEHKKNLNLPALLNIGTCNLHVVHGAFGKALKEFGSDIADFVIDIHYFFKLSPVRVGELATLQEKHNLKVLKFLKHVDCRWLTLVPALERIVAQWTVISEYFITELPKRDSQLSQNSRYQRILKCIKESNQTLVKLHFLVSISSVLLPFLAFFQREEPLIHLLHEYMNKIVRSVYGRFLKIEAIKGESIENLRKIQFPSAELELKDRDIEIGAETRKSLNTLKPEIQKEMLVLMRKFLRKLAQTLTEKLPFDNTVIKESRCLKPENLTKNWTVQSIKTLAAIIQHVPPLNVDIVVDEWKTLQCENIPKEWYKIEIDEEVTHQRIDFYYSKIFALKDALDQDKYPELKKIVKVVLVLPHGNADVERGFSQTSSYLTDTRVNLSETSISAIQTAKDTLKLYNNCCHKVPITIDFIKKGLLAHKSYLARLEEQKLKAAEEKKKKEESRELEKREKEALKEKKREFEEKTRQTKETIIKEKSLELKESETNKDIQAYKSLVDEANERIKNALRNKDMKAALIGQTMLEAACKKVDEVTTTLKDIRSEQKELEKNKRTMLDYFCSTQSKKFKDK